MEKTYGINLKSISLDYFKQVIKHKEMIPSRKILKENIEESFRVLANLNIDNLDELISSISSSQKMEIFSKRSGLSIDYLNILKREAASYNPKPINLNKFPDINPEIITKLECIGVKTSKHLFNSVQANAHILEPIEKEMPTDLEELISLSDLVRLYGVGPLFAKLIYQAGVKSINDFTTYSGKQFVEIYEKKTGKRADFSINDINFSLEIARLIIQNSL